MSAALSDEDRAGVGDLLDEFVGAVAAEPADAAALELAALEIQAPYAAPDAPPELVRGLPRALAERGDALACGLLAAIERLAPQPLAGLAAVARDQLEAAGVAPLMGGRLGTATVVSAAVMPTPDGLAEMWHAVLARPGSDQEQALVVVVEHEMCGAVVAAAAVGEPGDPESVRRPLRASARAVGDPRDIAPDPPAEALDADELTIRLRSALEHMERHGVALDAGAATILPLLERALTGDVGHLPRPAVAAPEDRPDPGESALREAADELLAAFAAALDADEHAEPELREHGPFVAHCMLSWKIDDADGRLERWTLGDLRELLLDWFPRKVTADEETVAIVAEAVTAFLGFLAAQGRLDAPVPLASLEAAVARLRPRFEAAYREPRNKAMLARMSEDGVDPSDRDAVEGWIARYNARAFEDRDALVGPAAGPSPARQRAERKAAEHARRRNRR